MSDPTTPEPTQTPAPTPSVDKAPTAKPEPQPYQASVRSSKLGYLCFIGFFFLVCGLVWRAVEKNTGVVTDVWIFAALLAMLVPPAWHASDLGRAVASRRGAAFGFVSLTLGL